MRHLRRIAVFVFIGALAVAGHGQTLTIGTLAGSTTGGGYVDAAGNAARFSLPRAIDADASGNLYVADASNHVIRKIAPGGVVTTIAGLAGQQGSSNGFGAAARFRYPRGIAVDRVRNLIYIGDTSNHIIRRMTADGNVVTFAGVAGAFGSTNGSGSTARFTFPRGLAVDASGNVYVADSGNHLIRKITPDGVVSTVAGNPLSSGSSDGFGSQAFFDFPFDIAFDPTSGNFYVSDNGNSTIRKVTPDGRVTTVAGNPIASGDEDGTGSEALLDSPYGLDVDAAGNVYFADSGNEKIRMITPAAVVTTFAGQGYTGANNGPLLSTRWATPSAVTVAPDGAIYIGDAYNNAIRVIRNGEVSLYAGSPMSNGVVNATGTAARFHFPYDVAVDSAGNAYVIETSCSIRKITPAGVVSTFAGTPGEVGSADGTGPAARFNFPQGITIDKNNNLYVADTYNHTIRKITPAGVVTTLAGLAGEFGSQDGSGTQARFFLPSRLVADPQGNLYVSDTYNHTIRFVEPAGVVTTFAGSGISGYYDGTGTIADFAYPLGITIDAQRNLYVADWGNDVIRKITQAGAVSTVAGNHNLSGATDGLGSNATFDGPNGIVSDPFGNLFVSEDNNHIIRHVTNTAVVTTVAGLASTPGNVNGTGRDARFEFPNGLALTPQGNLLIVDLYNHAVRIGTFAVPAIDSFTASPSHIDIAGSAVTLTWTTREATTASISGIGAVVPNGSRVVNPAATTTYTLTATGPGGTVTRSVTVFVGAAGRRRAARH